MSNPPMNYFDKIIEISNCIVVKLFKFFVFRVKMFFKKIFGNTSPFFDADISYSFDDQDGDLIFDNKMVRSRASSRSEHYSEHEALVFDRFKQNKCGPRRNRRRKCANKMINTGKSMDACPLTPRPSLLKRTQSASSCQSNKSLIFQNPHCAQSSVSCMTLKSSSTSRCIRASASRFTREYNGVCKCDVCKYIMWENLKSKCYLESIKVAQKYCSCFCTDCKERKEKTNMMGKDTNDKPEQMANISKSRVFTVDISLRETEMDVLKSKLKAMEELLILKIQLEAMDHLLYRIVKSKEKDVEVALTKSIEEIRDKLEDKKLELADKNRKVAVDDSKFQTQNEESINESEDTNENGTNDIVQETKEDIAMEITTDEPLSKSNLVHETIVKTRNQEDKSKSSLVPETVANAQQNKLSKFSLLQETSGSDGQKTKAISPQIQKAVMCDKQKDMSKTALVQDTKASGRQSHKSKFPIIQEALEKAKQRKRFKTNFIQYRLSNVKPNNNYKASLFQDGLAKAKAKTNSKAPLIQDILTNYKTRSKSKTSLVQNRLPSKTALLQDRLARRKERLKYKTPLVQDKSTRYKERSKSKTPSNQNKLTSYKELKTRSESKTSLIQDRARYKERSKSPPIQDKLPSSKQNLGQELAEKCSIIRQLKRELNQLTEITNEDEKTFKNILQQRIDNVADISIPSPQWRKAKHYVSQIKHFDERDRKVLSIILETIKNKKLKK